MNGENPKNLIMDVLKQHPEGLTISSIAEMSGLHRHTSRKYVNELISAGEVMQRLVGMAKLCYTNCVGEEAKIPQKKGFFSRFNLRLVISVAMITLLLSEVVISAYENESFNETMINNFSNTSPITSSMILNDSNITQMVESTIENFPNGSVGADSSSTSLNLTNEPNNSDISLILNDSNVTQIIESISNESGNLSMPQENVYPELRTSLEYPQKITRGKEFTVRIHVSNVGSVYAKNVEPSLNLPEGFEITSVSSDCSVLGPKESCVSEVTIKSSLSAVLGKNDFKAVVNYEE
ncbi:MAG: NEW3 domain-containing protein [Candidatus Bathyarchaeota archaeon]